MLLAVISSQGYKISDMAAMTWVAHGGGIASVFRSVIGDVGSGGPYEPKSAYVESGGAIPLLGLHWEHDWEESVTRQEGHLSPSSCQALSLMSEVTLSKIVTSALNDS